jgi:peptidoglycan/LPS O-acetylase OafA/YrhL
MDRGDYSYGIYLYGFPVQQTVAYLFPASREWYLNALFSLPVIIALAALSWHIIERPSLSLKKVLQGRRAKAIQADSALG